MSDLGEPRLKLVPLIPNSEIRIPKFQPYYAQISASVGTFLSLMTFPMRDTFIRCL